jgi:hypothetical protein
MARLRIPRPRGPVTLTLGPGLPPTRATPSMQATDSPHRVTPTPRAPSGTNLC